MKNIILENRENVCWIEKIKLYKDIFWESPWEEWFQCKNCSSIYSKNFMWQCNCWNSDFESFYKNDELKEEFSNISIKEKYSELIAKILEEEVWFIWWWNTSLDQLNIDKLQLNEEDLAKIKDNILKLFPVFNLDDFYYFSEIWVKNEYRWNDIAWELYRENLDKLKVRWEKYILLRTTKKSDVPYKWFKKEWFIDVFEYNDEQDRVILVCKI